MIAQNSQKCFQLAKNHKTVKIPHPKIYILKLFIGKKMKRYTGLIENYRSRLPVSETTRIISLGEGNTPLI